MAPRASNVFVALTCAVVFSSFSSTAYAQSCKINNCAVGSTCSPVEIGGGSVGKCAPPGAQGVAECHCLGTLPPPPTPSIQFLITTGGDNLRGDSSATATLFDTTGAQRQVITLKDQNQPSWDNNTLHSVVSELNTPASTLDHIDITLTSHPALVKAPTTGIFKRLKYSTIPTSDQKIGRPQRKSFGETYG